MTLTEFLLARIAEDEVNARSIQNAEWFHGVDADVEAEVLTLSDPARVLAEVAAKRAIVEEAGQFGLWEGGMAFIALCHLASVYADHPDFQAEWAEWAGRS